MMNANKATGLAVAFYATVVVYSVYQEYKLNKMINESYQMMDEENARLADRMERLRERLNNPRYAAKTDLAVEVINITREP
jgi:hypothetical protein